MNAYPSDLVYQSSSARRYDLTSEAAREQQRRAQRDNRSLAASLRQRTGRLLISFGNRLTAEETIPQSNPASVS